jgi:hypothetical protein
MAYQTLSHCFLYYALYGVKLTFDHLLIGMEGTKTPAGEARQARPHRHAVSRRLGGRPRKAKCLEWKSTTLVEQSPAVSIIT